MSELQSDVEVSWSGSGHEGAGRIIPDDLDVEFFLPASMGGRDIGTTQKSFSSPPSLQRGDDTGTSVGRHWALACEQE